MVRLRLPYKVMGMIPRFRVILTLVNNIKYRTICIVTVIYGYRNILLRMVIYGYRSYRGIFGIQASN